MVRVSHHKCKPDEFCSWEDSTNTVDLAQTITKRMVRSRLSQILVGSWILGCMAGTFISMRSMTASYISTIQKTPADLGDGGPFVKMIRKADKAELVERLQKLVDEKQQDVIVNVFTPVERSSSSSTLNSITCVTQGGVGKLQRLLDMTSRWLGPVSFSALVSSESDLDVLFQFWTDNPLIQEYVSLHILMELPQVQRPESGRYPINQLRNLALHNVKTDYVFLNDIDFIPSDHAHDQIAALIKGFPPSTKTFWVLPAFERLKANNTDPEDEVKDMAMIPKTKPELLEAVHQDKVVTTFHPYFPQGHQPTDYEKWYTFNDNSTMMYPIHYDKWFEPYVVCKTQDLHQYFPVFRGFGFNKNSFFVEAKVRNFTYYVLSHQFVVHMNHKGRFERNEQTNSHLGPMFDAFIQYLRNTYHVSNDEKFY